MDGVAGIGPTPSVSKTEALPLCKTPMKLVAVVGIEPTESVRTTDLQSVLPP